MVDNRTSGIFEVLKRSLTVGRLSHSSAEEFALQFDVVKIKKTNLPNSHQVVSDAFIEIALKGHRAVAEATLVGVELLAGMSTRSSDIIASSARGTKHLLSPFSGKLVEAAGSLGLEWYLIEDGGQVCLASQMGSTMVMVDLETVWVFPVEGLIIFIENGLDAASILKSTFDLSRRLRNKVSILELYLNTDRPRRLAISDFSCPHMSHNLWNIQTGLSNVLSQISSSGLTWVFFSNQNFFGKADELHPFVDWSNTHYVRDEDEVTDFVLRNNILLLTLKDEISSDLLEERILAWARSKCSSGFLKLVEELRAKSHPLILTTIRLDNRAWIEQADGLPAFFNRLRQDLPKLGLVIDGLSKDTAKGWTTGWMSLESELEMAHKIRDQLPVEMPLEFAVGRLFCEAIVLMAASEFFIAPSGSGMAIYKWVLRKPGFAFSNETVVDPKNALGWPLRVWHDTKYRSNMPPTIHVDKAKIQDGEIKRGQKTRADFHMKWQDLYDEVVLFISRHLPTLNH